MSPSARAGRIAGSLLIVAHVLAIVLTPNPQSFLLEGLSFWVRPYANELGLSAQWMLFAPNPSAVTLLEIRGDRGFSSTFPERGGSHLQEGTDRRVALLSMVAGFPRVRELVSQYLCRSSGSSSLEIAMVEIPAPTLEEVGRGVPLNDISPGREKVFSEWRCACPGPDAR